MHSESSVTEPGEWNVQTLISTSADSSFSLSKFGYKIIQEKLLVFLFFVGKKKKKRGGKKTLKLLMFQKNYSRKISSRIFPWGELWEGNWSQWLWVMSGRVCYVLLCCWIHNIFRLMAKYWQGFYLFKSIESSAVLTLLPESHRRTAAELNESNFIHLCCFSHNNWH